MSTVAVILAADAGEGFGSAKYATLFRGKPLLDGVLADAATWPVDDVMVVLGAGAEIVERTCDLSMVTVIVDPEWAEGMASPIRAALDFVSRDRGIERVVLARGDQPGVDASVVDAILDEATASGSAVVVPKYRYAVGWPVLIGAPMRDVFLGMEGPIDVLDVISSHSHAVSEVWFDRLQPTAMESAADLLNARR